MDYNPYTCRLFRRFDWLIYKMMFFRVAWRGGRLCRISKNDVASEATGFFPGFMYSAATWIQNKWLWTRKILSA